MCHESNTPIERSLPHWQYSGSDSTERIGRDDIRSSYIKLDE